MFEEDLSCFFADFAQPVLVTNPGNQTEIQGIFDNAFVTVVDQVASSGPQLTVKTVDVEAAGLAKSSTLTVAGREYTIADIEPDGTGITTISLHYKRKGG